MIQLPSSNLPLCSAMEECTQKVGFAKQLASCDKRTRDRAVRALESWLMAQPRKVSDEELKKIWKGLFYCVWHADKRHVQADVIEKLASLIRTLDLSLARDYLQVFLLTMRREWSGIDHLRLDKFYLMLTRFLHFVFLRLDTHGWPTEVTQDFMRVLAEGSFLAVDKFSSRGINLHFVDVYLKEIAEFLPLKEETFGLVFEPLYSVLARVSDRVLVDRVRCNVFERLVEKGRDLVKRRRDDGEEDDNVEKFGCVALTMGIGKRLLELATEESSMQANRKVLYDLHDEFGKLEKAFLASGVVAFSKRVNRPTSVYVENTKSRVPADEEEASGHGNQRVEDKMEVDEQGRLATPGDGIMKVKRQKSKKVKKSHDDGSQEADDKMEIVQEGMLDADCALKKVKKGKQRKVKKSVDNEYNIVIVEGGVMSTGNGVEKVKKGKTKKVKKETKSVTVKEGTESSFGMLVRIKKLNGSFELREKKSKSQLKERMNITEEAVADTDVHEEQSVASLDENKRDSFEFGGSVISNLQKEFEKVAAELGENTDDCSFPDATLATPLSHSFKKRKRVKNALKEVNSISSLGQDNGGITAGSVHPNGISSCSKSEEKATKKVRFSMKRNIVWKPTSPLPPENLRMPPSATPRGSALKKGVPPGPIRIAKESPSPQRRMLLSLAARKGRKKLKSISSGTRLVRKQQSNVWKINSV